MYREIVLHLRKKKFRLLTLWKQRLEQRFPLTMKEQYRPPPMLLFRSFDECLRLLRQENQMESAVPGNSPLPLYDTLSEQEKTARCRLLEVYLVGEEVICTHLLQESSAYRHLPPREISAFVHHLFHTWHNLIIQQIALSPHPQFTEAIPEAS